MLVKKDLKLPTFPQFFFFRTSFSWIEITSYFRRHFFFCIPKYFLPTPLLHQHFVMNIYAIWLYLYIDYICIYVQSRMSHRLRVVFFCIVQCRRVSYSGSSYQRAFEKKHVVHATTYVFRACSAQNRGALHALPARISKSEFLQIFKWRKVHPACSFLVRRGRFAQGHSNQSRPPLLAYTNSGWRLGGNTRSWRPKLHLPWVLGWNSFEKGFLNSRQRTSKFREGSFLIAVVYQHDATARNLSYIDLPVSHKHTFRPRSSSFLPYGGDVICVWWCWVMDNLHDDPDKQT